jgi:colanic acid biosynthesis glycosyl transferase WcaI
VAFAVQPSGQDQLALPRPRAASAPGAPRRRVIFVNRYFFPDLSATSQMLTDLVRELGQQCFELHVICSRQLYDDANARLPARDHYADARLHRCWSARFGRDRLPGRALDYASFLVSSTLALLRLARRGDIIVAMTDPPLISVCAAVAARVRGARLVNWLQDVFPEVAMGLRAVQLPLRALKWLVAARNWSLRAADRNVVLGIGMQRFLSRLSIPAGKQRLIENWADAADVPPRPVHWSELRRSLGPDVRFVIEYSGNMGRAHDYRTLLGAMLELEQERGWLFLFVGAGAGMSALRVEAERQQLRNVRFLPLQPRASLPDSLAAADVHVTCLQPQLEGLVVPSKLYGILAAGRPVIVIGDLDGEQARVVRSEGCGSVIACGDNTGLVDELRRMRSEPEWMHAAGLRARVLFERRYTLAAAVRKWRTELERIGEASGGRGAPSSIAR